MSDSNAPNQTGTRTENGPGRENKGSSKNRSAKGKKTGKGKPSKPAKVVDLMDKMLEQASQNVGDRTGNFENLDSTVKLTGARIRPMANRNGQTTNFELLLSLKGPLFISVPIEQRAADVVALVPQVVRPGATGVPLASLWSGEPNRQPGTSLYLARHMPVTGKIGGIIRNLIGQIKDDETYAKLEEQGRIVSKTRNIGGEEAGFDVLQFSLEKLDSKLWPEFGVYGLVMQDGTVTFGQDQSLDFEGLPTWVQSGQFPIPYRGSAPQRNTQARRVWERLIQEAMLLKSDYPTDKDLTIGEAIKELRGMHQRNDPRLRNLPQQTRQQIRSQAPGRVPVGDQTPPANTIPARSRTGDQLII